MHFDHPPIHNTLHHPGSGKEAHASKGGDDDATFCDACRSITPVRGARSSHFDDINNMASDASQHHRRRSRVCVNNNSVSSHDNESGNHVSDRLKRDDNSSSLHVTVVGIDKDKHSPHAVRWAIDNLLMDNPVITLIHVKSKHHDGSERADANIRDLFLLYRGYCARKRVQLKEAVVEGNDIPKALLEYVANNYITNLVLGATSRKALARKLKYSDVSSAVMKSTPDFCNVYVIAKGKVSSVRQARRVAMNTATPPRMPSPMRQLSPPISPPADHFELSDSVRGRRRSLGPEMLSPACERMRSLTPNLSVDSIDIHFGMRSPSRDSISDLSDISNGRISLNSMDVNDPNYDFVIGSESPANPAMSHSSRELEAEMKRLKLELKQTMEMYSSACKEAISAKRKAEELHQLKMEELQRFEEARHAEETALQIVEMEKAKCKAALEAAEKAQKLAETEAQKRKLAELKARKEAREKDRALTVLHQNDVRYRKYTIYEIEEATDKFLKSNKIGEGGYGPVYKGRLDHTPVAIKVLRPDAAQGKRQFHQEVEVLCRMRHPNMVLLLGACPEYGCLVYEYMDFGSLEDRLFRKGNTPPISLMKRFDIAAEIATALLYLHQAKPEPLVHRDLKPANILLDRNYKSKISDVGLARLVPPSVADSVTQYHMTSAAGTFCYIDPEYQQTGKLTTRSDVYSLGILFLQIITAKPPMGLSHHVLTAVNTGKFEEMLDPTMHDWPMEETLAFAKLALKCCELRKRDRPDLTTVVPELNRLRDFGRKTDAEDENDHTYHHISSSTPTGSTGLPSPGPTQATLHTHEGAEAEHT